MVSTTTNKLIIYSLPGSSTIFIRISGLNHVYQDKGSSQEDIFNLALLDLLNLN